jgi:hypothetical protein
MIIIYKVLKMLCVIFSKDIEKMDIISLNKISIEEQKFASTCRKIYQSLLHVHWIQFRAVYKKNYTSFTLGTGNCPGPTYDVSNIF